MSGINLSITEDFIRERIEGRTRDFEDGNYAGMALVNRTEQEDAKNSNEKTAQRVALQAVVVEGGLSEVLDMFAGINLEPGHPEYRAYSEAVDRVMDVRTNNASFGILCLLRNIHAGDNSIVDFLGTAESFDVIPTPQEARHANTTYRTYVKNGPDQAFFDWSGAIVDAATASTDTGVDALATRALNVGKVTAELVQARAETGQLALEDALKALEICISPIATLEGLLNEEDKQRILSYADATLTLLRQNPRWQANPGYLVRGSAFTYTYETLRYQAEGRGTSELEFAAEARRIQRERVSKQAAEARLTAQSVTVVEMIEKPATDLEAHEIARELAALVNPPKDAVKKQLGETSKRVDQGDNDSLVRLMPCPERAQGFAKKLILTVAQNKNPEQVLELLAKTAERDAGNVSDDTVAAIIEASRWFVSNIAALAHPRYTYRAFAEGQLVKEAKNRYEAFRQAQELALANEKSQQPLAS